jgi:hypothetical protein
MTNQTTISPQSQPGTITPEIVVNPVYPTGLLKPRRKRSTAAEMEKLLDATLEIVGGEEYQITLRHLFYRLVTLGLIPKTERAYGNLAGHLSKWRKSGRIGFHHFVDSTRYYSGKELHDQIDTALEGTVAGYRRNLWQDQDVRIEIWTEKDAIRALAGRVADDFGIQTFACKGFPSLSSLHSFAEGVAISDQCGKRTVVLYLGDFDEAGLRIDESIVKTVREIFKVEFTFTRLAVTEEIIHRFNLPTRPPKGKSRMARCVEIDALSSGQIRELLEREILRYIDEDRWSRQLRTEELERETLTAFLQNWEGAF